jgi:hypothetical protein
MVHQNQVLHRPKGISGGHLRRGAADATTGGTSYRPRPQAFSSVIRMIPTTFPSLNACSFVPLLQVQTKFFLAVKVIHSCSIRSYP